VCGEVQVVVLLQSISRNRYAELWSELPKMICGRFSAGSSLRSGQRNNGRVQMTTMAITFTRFSLCISRVHAIGHFKGYHLAILVAVFVVS
jgi:hypothetical protein